MKKIEVSVNTTKEYLESQLISMEDIKNEVHFLMSVFKKKYTSLFPIEIKTNDILLIMRVAKILRGISDREGFNRHIKEYNPQEFSAHFFTARVALFLKNNGYNVTLEPSMDSKSGPHPDLKIEKNDITTYVECKTSDISRYYDLESKKEVANIVYDSIKTCDQINFYFKKPIDLDAFRTFFSNDILARYIYSLYERGKDGKESRFMLDNDIEISVIQKPTIIGAEEDFLDVRLDVLLGDTQTNDRSIGFVFMRGGRSIGVFEQVDYTNKLRNKKEQSQGQLVEGYPNVVFLRDSDVLGSTELHKEYIQNNWLTEDNPSCSAVIMFENYETVWNENLTETVTTYCNQYASNQFVLDINSKE